MDKAYRYFYSGGKFILATALIWVGVVGFLDVGFTTIQSLPLIQIDYVTRIIYAIQITLGLSLVNYRIRVIAKPVAIIYILLLGFSFYEGFELLFEPAIPYLSDYGRSSFIELVAAIGLYGYIYKQ